MSRIFKGIRTWRGGGLYAGLLGGLVALALAPAHTSAQSVEDKYQQLRDRKSLFNLGADPSVFLSVNKLQCGATSEGETCVDTFGSPTGGGGFFPAGTSDQYVFSSGLQVAGVITAGPGCDKTNRNKVTPTPACFAWSGDTTAALFFEGSGNLHHGTPITAMYNSLDPNDLAIWPTPGSIPDFPEATSMIVNDTSLYNDVLIGRKAASQQDSWVAYWDGDPARSGGRTHPMGILTEQRTLAWAYPDGNEATMYLVYRLTNVTNNRLFQTTNENKYFGGLDSLPDAGWTFDSVYVAYAADPDVCAGGGNNQGSGIMPFSMAIAYHTAFTCTGFAFPPDVYHAPFAKAPGIVGFKFLKSPNDPKTGQQLGLTALSLNTNGAPFPDANSVAKAWRYLSLNVDASKGDGTCSYPVSQIKAKRACYLGQTKVDVRIYEASGPMSLAPGQSATIAASIIAAAPVATPLISFSPSADNLPGIPSLAPGCFGTTVRPIEVAAGWIAGTGTCPADTLTVMDQTTVKAVPGSLLGKALVAQSIFNNKFLLGFAPEPPTFYLVPGDNQVTVIWDPSATETNGDPFFVAAGNPNSPLFDPNYRKFDVEGYRIYRGNTAGQLSLIAQFDKSGTNFTDKTCAFDPTHVTGSPCTVTTTVPINGDFVQYQTVGQLASGDPIPLAADTALAAQVHAGTSKGLSDTGVPFAFVDTQVRNGFTYFYKVTAFDINSLKSGPSSLESAGPVKTVIPRVASNALSAADFGISLMGRTKTLNPNAPLPTIDPVKGTFSGPQPPANTLTGTFQAYATQLLAAGAKEIRIDSIKGEYFNNGVESDYYFTVDGVPVAHTFTNASTNGSGTETFQFPTVSFNADPSVRATLTQQGVDAPGLAGSMVASITVDRAQWNSAFADWAPKQTGFYDPDQSNGAYVGGSRWFDGTNETMADPTDKPFNGHGSLTGITKIFKPTPYAYLATPNASATNVSDSLAIFRGPAGTSGATLANAGDIWRRFDGTVHGLVRGADVKIFWGAGKVDSVIDVTHDVAVPFTPNLKAGYGFLQDADANGVLNYGDFYYLPGLENTANINTYSTFKKMPLAAQPVVLPTAAVGSSLASSGNGFGLFIDGETYLFNGAVPTNTVWTLRSYEGTVTKSTAGVYSFAGKARNAAVPGLRLVAKVVAPATIIATNADLKQVHAVPDPYYGVSLFDLGPANKELQFVNLPPVATVRIYSVSGVLVDIVNHNDPTGGGTAKWDLRNRSNQFVASGVYIFHVSTPEGKSAIGKFTVVNSGLGQ